MVQHSLSHAAASLVGLVGTQILANRLEAYFPTFYDWIGALSRWIIDIFHLSVRGSQMELVLVALLAGLFWGMVFWQLSARRVIR